MYLPIDPRGTRTLAGNDGHPGRQLLTLFRTHLLDVQVAIDDAEDVHLLPLVLVNTLDLNIEQGRRVDTVAGRFLDIPMEGLVHTLVRQNHDSTHLARRTLLAYLISWNSLRKFLSFTKLSTLAN